MGKQKVTIYNRDGQLSSREYVADEQEIGLVMADMARVGVTKDTMFFAFEGRPVKQMVRLCNWAKKKALADDEWDINFHLREWGNSNPAKTKEVA